MQMEAASPERQENTEHVAARKKWQQHRGHLIRQQQRILKSDRKSYEYTHVFLKDKVMDCICAYMWF